MNYDQQLSEQKLNYDFIRIKSTLQYIDEDIVMVMKKVKGKSYRYQIPNPFEKLTLFGEDLTAIKGRLKIIMDQIDMYENQLSSINEVDISVSNSDLLTRYQNIRMAMVASKVDYKMLKSKIIQFTDSLEKNV